MVRGRVCAHAQPSTYEIAQTLRRHELHRCHHKILSGHVVYVSVVYPSSWSQKRMTGSDLYLSSCELQLPSVSPKHGLHEAASTGAELRSHLDFAELIFLQTHSPYAAVTETVRYTDNQMSKSRFGCYSFRFTAFLAG